MSPQHLTPTQQQMKEWIRYATLAPSGHNTQPWKFSIHENRITIYPDYRKRLPMVDPDDHALFISLGCALENLIIAAKHFGYQPRIVHDLNEQESEAIHVDLIKRNESSGNTLFRAIPTRQATRSTYDGKPIPEKDLEALRDASAQEGVRFKIFTDPADLERLTELVKQGNRLQFNNKAFVNELISWIRFNKSAAKRTRDGLYGASMGAPSVPRWLGQLFIKLASAEKEAQKCEKAIQSSAALMLFIAENNDKQSWIHVGRSFERVALAAAQRHIRHAHLNMPCEEPSLREELQHYLGLQNEQPLLLLRIGYAAPMPDSFRKPVEDVLINYKR